MLRRLALEFEQQNLFSEEEMGKNYDEMVDAAFMVLHEQVIGEGNFDDDEIKSIRYLYSLIPTVARYSGPLYRGISIRNDLVERLLDNNQFTGEYFDRSIESWASSPQVALSFAHYRSDPDMEEDMVGVVVKSNTAGKDIVFDLNAKTIAYLEEIVNKLGLEEVPYQYKQVMNYRNETEVMVLDDGESDVYTLCQDVIYVVVHNDKLSREDPDVWKKLMGHMDEKSIQQLEEWREDEGFYYPASVYECDGQGGLKTLIAGYQGNFDVDLGESV